MKLKAFIQIACLALTMAIAPLAKADPITGAIRLSPPPGGPVNAITFDDTHVQFTPNSAQVDRSTIVGGLGLGYTGLMATLQSFTFSNAANTVLFSVNNGLDILSFTISNILSHTFSSFGSDSALTVFGAGTFTETPTAAGAALGLKAFTPTSGTFTLTASNSGITGFQLNGSVAATPEPSSLLLLGTGLIGAAAMLLRRRRAEFA